MNRSSTAEAFRAALGEQLAYFERETTELVRKAYPDAVKMASIQTLIGDYCELARSWLEGGAEHGPDDLAWIGSNVVVLDETDGTEETYRLVMPHEIDADLGHISFLSPLGRRLLTAKGGDRLEVKSPAGSYYVRLTEVRYGD